MTSIITNTSAMTALQTLKSINSNLASAQNEISTGKTISTAKDNAAIWSITKVMESDVSGINSIKTALDLGGSTVSVAREATESIVKDLQSIQDLVVQAQAENVDKETLQTQITNKMDSIRNYISGAQFNGLNFLNTTGDDVKVLAALNRDNTGAVSTDTIDIERNQLYDGSAFTGALAGLEGLDVETAADATALQAAMTAINSVLSATTKVASYYGAKEAQIASQSEFMGKLSDAMTAGIGTLVDADMEEASARLTALQTQQQLGIQALSIANQTPQNILALFR
ncbi:flagellin N-terminal helical domain-containing protein [Paenirhodobacter populi]|uniref:Flagellin n=1 Tax=Paenirhodobacter populi TaxID=2306993 RepID=A0A443JNI2_9RHOB|nr:flagellin [Sinirhodobacter populi]RWR22081.1 flagellin [Sinirhodobacter populi]